MKLLKALLVLSMAVLFVAGEDCVQLECPDVDPEIPEFDLTLVPDAHNCSQYISCFHGVQTTMSCPPNLHFNAELHVCDFPAAAKCEEC